jgi:hypothetical protein
MPGIASILPFVLGGCVENTPPPASASSEPAQRPSSTRQDKDAPASVLPAPGSTEGFGLAPEQIRPVVIASLQDFQHCYEAGLERAPELKGMVVVAFAVAPSGVVIHAESVQRTDAPPLPASPRESTTLPDESVVECIVGKFRRLTFPEAPRRTNVQFPMKFAPNSGGPPSAADRR